MRLGLLMKMVNAKFESDANRRRNASLTKATSVSRANAERRGFSSVVSLWIEFEAHIRPEDATGLL